MYNMESKDTNVFLIPTWLDVCETLPPKELYKMALTILCNDDVKIIQRDAIKFYNFYKSYIDDFSEDSYSNFRNKMMQVCILRNHTQFLEILKEDSR